MLQLFDNKYPYTDFHELNLDWIISRLIQMDHKLTNFVNLNTIKYADPIAWDITKQYETNTVVIDNNTGIAYISTKPVPAGVSIGDTDYWSVIFDLQQIIGYIASNLTFHDNGTSPTLLGSVQKDDWILWNNKLYVALADLIAGTALIVGTNIDEASVEDLTKTYTDSLGSTLNAIIGSLAGLNTSDQSSVVNAINEVLAKEMNTRNMIGALADLNTSDTTSIVNAINSVLSDLNTIIGNLANLATSDQTSIVNAINELVAKEINTRSMIGTLSDLNTSDKTNTVNAINEVYTDLQGEISSRTIADSGLSDRISRLEGWSANLYNKRVLILGDSLSADNGDDTNDTWVEPFKAFVETNGGSVDNQAISGAGIATMWTIAQSITNTYDLVIIFVGVNDSYLSHAIGDMTVAGSFAKVYKETIDYIRANSPNAIFYCVSVGYYGTNEFKSKYNPAFYSAAIKSVCDYVGANFIDISQMPNVSLYHDVGQYADQVHYTKNYSQTVLYRYIRDKILNGVNDKFNKHFDYANKLTAAAGVTIASQHCEIDVMGYMHLRAAFTLASAVAANTTLFTFDGDLRNNQRSFVKNGGYASLKTTNGDTIITETAINAGSYEMDMTFTSPYITEMLLS